MKAVVAERGQVTIPKVLREQLGIRSGTVLDFAVKNCSLVVIKAEQADVVESVYGALDKLNTDLIMNELRGEI